MAAESSTQSSPALNEQEREELIKEHVGLVHYIVGRVSVRLPDNVEREDLESAGLIGLIKATDRFDPGRGVKFATYASSVIRGEVMEALRAKDWAPRSVRRLGRDRRLTRMIEQLNAYLRGWYGYFGQVTGAGRYDMRELDGFARRRMRSAIAGRHAHGRWHQVLPNPLLTALGLESLEFRHETVRSESAAVPVSG